MPSDSAESGALADAVIDLGRLALAFGRINRTACWHPDGQQRESDADHTVMLGWIAPALAQRLYPGELDAALVAQFALLHDMAEVYAGDTPTLRIDDAGREAKAKREHAAGWRIWCEFIDSLPWIPRTLADYEQQRMPEVRFVRAVDKLLTKIVHLLDGAKGLIEEEMTVSEMRQIFDRQAADMATYAGEFTALMDLRAELVDRTIALLDEISESEQA
jgi:putative hydrolase of HD superfamily